MEDSSIGSSKNQPTICQRWLTINGHRTCFSQVHYDDIRSVNIQDRRLYALKQRYEANAAALGVPIRVHVSIKHLYW